MDGCGELHGHFAVHRFGGDLESRFAFEHAAQALSHDLMVVHQENTNLNGMVFRAACHGCRIGLVLLMPGRCRDR